ncbi:MAG TPA: hypothetical protein VGC28_07045 [Sphingomonas sp.]
MVQRIHSPYPLDSDPCASRLGMEEVRLLSSAAHALAGERCHRIATHILSYEDIETSIVAELIPEKRVRAQIFSFICEYAEAWEICWFRFDLQGCQAGDLRSAVGEMLRTRKLLASGFTAVGLSLHAEQFFHAEGPRDGDEGAGRTWAAAEDAGAVGGARRNRDPGHSQGDDR